VGMPGERGLTGAASTVPGPMGLSIPGQDGQDGEDSFIPGAAGPSGAASTVPGAPGADGADGEDGVSIPGLPGAAGATGSASTVPGPAGPPGLDGEGSEDSVASGGPSAALQGPLGASVARWPMIFDTVNSGETCTIPAGYQLLVASRFSVLGTGRLENNGKLAVL